jgi:hypothetical protein
MDYKPTAPEGRSVADDPYFTLMADAYGILLVADEVMSGFAGPASGSPSITGASRPTS